MADEAPSEDQLLDAIGFRIWKDGRFVEMRFRRKDGTVANVYCAFDDLSAVFSRIGQASGKARELQIQSLGGVDPREVYPVNARRVSKIQVATTTEERPLLSIVLENGIQFELSLPEEAIPELLARLEELQQRLDERSSRPH
jgi:hypothetical protein